MYIPTPPTHATAAAPVPRYWMMGRHPYLVAPANPCLHGSSVQVLAVGQQHDVLSFPRVKPPVASLVQTDYPYRVEYQIFRYLHALIVLSIVLGAGNEAQGY